MTTTRTPLIVTRHAGVVAWLESRGITGEVVAHATGDDVLGRVIIGVLPLSLAAQADEVWSIDLPRLPFELRGKERSSAQMDEAGACIEKYRVARIEGGQ